jgi:hypothetical protein
MGAEVTQQKLQFMQKEDARQEHKSLFEEWKKVQLNIRLLRQDIRETSIDGLVKRKNKLAFELGLK